MIIIIFVLVNILNKTGLIFQLCRLSELAEDSLHFSSRDQICMAIELRKTQRKNDGIKNVLFVFNCDPLLKLAVLYFRDFFLILFVYGCI